MKETQYGWDDEYNEVIIFESPAGGECKCQECFERRHPEI